jgi:hypothetical protein
MEIITPCARVVVVVHSHTKAHTARPVDVVLNLLSPFIFIFTLVERVLEKKKTTENVTLSVIFGADE